MRLRAARHWADPGVGPGQFEPVVLRPHPPFYRAVGRLPALAQPLPAGRSRFRHRRAGGVGRVAAGHGRQHRRRDPVLAQPGCSRCPVGCAGRRRLWQPAGLRHRRPGRRVRNRWPRVTSVDFRPLRRSRGCQHPVVGAGPAATPSEPAVDARRFEWPGLRRPATQAALRRRPLMIRPSPCAGPGHPVAAGRRLPMTLRCSLVQTCSRCQNAANDKTNRTHQRDAGASASRRPRSSETGTLQTRHTKSLTWRRRNRR